MNTSLASLVSTLLGTETAVPQNQGVSGQLIELASYALGHPPDRYIGIYARACAIEGFPVGLLTGDGKVYQIIGDYAANANAKLVPFMLSKSVTVTGAIGEKDGIPTITASDVK